MAERPRQTQTACRRVPFSARARRGSDLPGCRLITTSERRRRQVENGKIAPGHRLVDVEEGKSRPTPAPLPTERDQHLNAGWDYRASFARAPHPFGCFAQMRVLRGWQLRESPAS